MIIINNAEQQSKADDKYSNLIRKLKIIVNEENVLCAMYQTGKLPWTSFLCKRFFPVAAQILNLINTLKGIPTEMTACKSMLDRVLNVQPQNIQNVPMFKFVSDVRVNVGVAVVNLPQFSSASQ